MTSLKSNPLLKWLVIPMIVLVVVLGIKLASRGPGPKPASGEIVRLTPKEMKAVGVEGDTPRDTVATLVAQVKQLRNELHTALNDNKNAKDENERLRAREGAIDQRIQSTVDAARGHLEQDRDQVASEHQQTQSLLQDLQHRLDSLSGKGKDASKADLSDVPVGLGLDDDDSKNIGGSQDDTRWIEPEDGRPRVKASSASSAEKSSANLPTSFEQEPESGASESRPPKASARDDPSAAVEPVYTAPANATLMGSISMTALVGRVPIDGTVTDPYPFKAIIGRDNLAANGIDLPELAGAVVSGTASGDWTLSCVRGQIRTVTFVFQDGTVRTLPSDGKQGDASGQGGGQSGSTGSHILGGLGWISDPYGVPCISGERRSNAQQYLGSQALITAAGAAAASLIKPGSGDEAVVANNSGTLGTVGIGGNAAMGRILAGGVHDAAEWVNKLYGQAFAAVYVQPGAPVAIHLEQPLNIDYDPHGRRVNHRQGEPHVSDLD